jgi:starch synthase (maltosyl-transferring)
MDWSDHFDVYDEVSGETYHWGAANFVQLQPWRAVAHILWLRRPTQPHVALIV